MSQKCTEIVLKEVFDYDEVEDTIKEFFPAVIQAYPTTTTKPPNNYLRDVIDEMCDVTTGGWAITAHTSDGVCAGLLLISDVCQSSSMHGKGVQVAHTIALPNAPKNTLASMARVLRNRAEQAGLSWIGWTRTYRNKAVIKFLEV